MSSLKWVLTGVFASMIALSLSAVPTGAKKQPPPPTGPQIVAFSGAYAMDSGGNLYRVDRRASEPCIASIEAAFVGSLFGGPPPSRVIDVGSFNGGIAAALENGDIYYWCTDTGLPGYSVYAGNIFEATGVAAARVPDSMPHTFAPSFPTEPEPERVPVREGAVR